MDQFKLVAKTLMVLISFVLIGLSGNSNQVEAQSQCAPPYCYPPGTLRISGYPFTCRNAPTIIDPRIGDIARAAPGQAIWMHPMVNNFPPGVIGFVFAHECAHFIGIRDEQQADRWAIKIGRNQGWIVPSTVNQICQSVYFSSGDWTHFPGPLRCANMVNAFSTR